MDEFELMELKLRIAPEQSAWPAPDFIHTRAIHDAADTARDRVAMVYKKIREVNADNDLSESGRERKRAKVALYAIAEHESDKSLLRAREQVDAQLARWSEKQGTIIRQPSDQREVALFQEIRAHFCDMKGSKLDAINKLGDDPLVLSALLSAPSFLSGLSEVEVIAARAKADVHLDPQIVEARQQTTKAMAQCEKAWARSIDLIAEKANLVRDVKGAWKVAA